MTVNCEKVPAFSIIIPVYNVEAYLHECLESVMAQTFTDWEAICVDDGSTDGSWAILEEYSRREKRFVVVRQQNEGVVAARLRGFKASTGRRILFLDGDDLLNADALKTLAAISMDIDYIKFGFRYIKDGAEISRVIISVVNGELSRDEVLASSARSPLEIVGMCIGDKCYKRDIVEKAFGAVGDVRIAHSEDGLFALASFWASKRIIFLNGILYDYRSRESSASHVFDPRIVGYKEAFVSAAVDIAKQLGGQSESRCRKEFDFHARQALGHIFVLSLDSRLRKDEAYCLLTNMSKTKFFRHEKSSWNPAKHLLMRLLVKMPSICIAFRSVLRMMVRNAHYQTA